MNGKKLRLKTKQSLKTKFRLRLLHVYTSVILVSIAISGFYYFANPEKSKASTNSEPSPNAFNGCFATEIVSYTPQKRIDGSVIPNERRNAQLALGQPQNTDELNFVSLGFGGELVLKFSNPVANGVGNDVRIFESTFGNQPCARYPEKIQAFASQDGCRWVYLGEACQDASFDFGPLAWAQFIRLRDNSSLNHPYAGEFADGYDVDGIMCLNGIALNSASSAMVYGTPQTVIAYNQGLRRNGTAIHQSRTNQNQALGEPQDDDLGINFTTLGFNGSMILKFDYVIFDHDGPDLRVVETSFGQQLCSAYPEKAYFEGSLDGITYAPLGDVCLDGTLDLGVTGMVGLNFLRITDRSPATFFSESSDGFDLDGIETLHPPCSATNLSMREYEHHTGNNFQDKTVNVRIWPNPFRELLNISLTEGSVDQGLELSIFNFVGQSIYQKELQIVRDETELQIETDKLTPGIYMINIKNGKFEKSYRVVKTR